MMVDDGGRSVCVLQLGCCLCPLMQQKKLAVEASSAMPSVAPTLP